MPDQRLLDQVDRELNLIRKLEALKQAKREAEVGRRSLNNEELLRVRNSLKSQGKNIVSASTLKRVLPWEEA